jgi:dTDP-4-dehydrorhamnose 3,5-epimerase-like enzyme
MSKVTIEKLPETKEIDGAKRWEEEKGEFVQISYLQEIRHLAFFELKRGFTRGSHFHKKKDEFFYVIRGRLRAVFLDMETSAKEEHILGKGDRLRVEPGCGHIFYGMEDSLVVEYSPQIYDKEDSYKVDFEE